MKVVHFLDSFGVGGAETWLLGQMHYLKHHPEFSLEMHFVITGSAEGELKDEFFELASGIYEIPVGRNAKWSDVNRLRSLFKKENFHAVHFHSDFLSGFPQLLLAGLLPPVVVTHFHNAKYQQRYIYGISLGRRFALRVAKVLSSTFSTHFLGTSANILEKYNVNHWLYNRIVKRPLYCFFDTEKFVLNGKKPSLVNRYNLLFIGRFDSSISPTHTRNGKNSALVLLILAKMIELGHECHLVMLGKNDHSLSLHKKLIDDLGLNDHVRLVGIQKDVVPFLSNADLLLFPSREEGMGLVAVEAQLAKVRVLKSHGVPDEVVCVPSAVESLPVDSSLKDWSQKAIDLLQRMPDWSDADFGAFDIDRQFPELLNIYRDGR